MYICHVELSKWTLCVKIEVPTRHNASKKRPRISSRIGERDREINHFVSFPWKFRCEASCLALTWQSVPGSNSNNLISQGPYRCGPSVRCPWVTSCLRWAFLPIGSEKSWRKDSWRAAAVGRIYPFGYKYGEERRRVCHWYCWRRPFSVFVPQWIVPRYPRKSVNFQELPVLAH